MPSHEVGGSWLDVAMGTAQVDMLVLETRPCAEEASLAIGTSAEPEDTEGCHTA
jgi:hypothetical protein